MGEIGRLASSRIQWLALRLCGYSRLKTIISCLHVGMRSSIAHGWDIKLCRELEGEGV